MSTVRTSRTTAYKEYVFSNLVARIAEGQGIYTYIECAALVGLKPTSNFKRRVKQMADAGLLVKHVVYTERGNLEFRFGLPEAVKSEENPQW